MTGLLPPMIAYSASSWNPTLLVNTEAFQTVDEGDSNTNIEFRFGQNLRETITYDRSNSRFKFSRSILVGGNVTATGSIKAAANLSGSSLNVDRHAGIYGTLTVSGATNLRSTVRLNNVTYTFPEGDGSASGKVLKTNAAGQLSWSADQTAVGGSGLSQTDGDARYVNTAGDTMTGALKVRANLSGTSLTVDNSAAVYGNLTTSGTLATKSNLTINQDADANDTVLTFGSDTLNETLTWFNTAERFRFSDDLSVAGNLSGSSLTVDNNAALYGKLTVSGATTLRNAVNINWKNQYSGSTLLNVRGGMSGRSLHITGTGANPLFYTNTGLSNIGIGTTNTQSGDMLTVGGDIALAGRTDFTGAFSNTNATPGTFGAGASVTGISSAVTYNGKVYVATKKTDAAGIYRYDGGGTWTLVTNAVGKVVAADTANNDAYVLTVWSGSLVAGTQNAANQGSIYYSSNPDSGSPAWTRLNTTQGTFVTTANIDGVSDLAVFNGALYFGTQETNLAEMYRYQPGQGVASAAFYKISFTTAGRIVTGDATDADGYLLTNYNGRLWVGVKTGSTTGRVFSYDGLTWTLINATRGTFTYGTTSEPDVTAMGVYNGALFIGIGRANLANIYKYNGGQPGAASGSIFSKITATSGRIDPTQDATDIDGVKFLRTYNGRLYAGSDTGAAGNTGGLYEFDGVGRFNLVSSTTRGTLGAQTNLDSVDLIIPFDGMAYIGTGDSGGTASVHTWQKFVDNSNALQFLTPSNDRATIRFSGNVQAGDNNSQAGTFMFSNTVALRSGAYDYAEDYPTKDDSLEAGDLVSIDTTTSEYVKKAGPGRAVVGIVSANPGFRLSQDPAHKGARHIPVALAGRVPVKVSNENGAILAGDFLTASSTPGVAMRATKPGMVIGQAMDSWSGKEQGSVMTFISNQYFPGIDPMPSHTPMGVQALLEKMQSEINLLKSTIQQLQSPPQNTVDDSSAGNAFDFGKQLQKNLVTR